MQGSVIVGYWDTGQCVAGQGSAGVQRCKAVP